MHTVMEILFVIAFVGVIGLKIFDIVMDIYFTFIAKSGKKTSRRVGGDGFKTFVSDILEGNQQEQHRLFMETSQRAHDEGVRMHNEAMQTHIDTAIHDHQSFINNDFMNNMF